MRVGWRTGSKVLSQKRILETKIKGGLCVRKTQLGVYLKIEMNA